MIQLSFEKISIFFLTPFTKYVRYSLSWMNDKLNLSSSCHVVIMSHGLSPLAFWNDIARRARTDTLNKIPRQSHIVLSCLFSCQELELNVVELRFDRIERIRNVERSIEHWLSQWLSIARTINRPNQKHSKLAETIIGTTF